MCTMFYYLMVIFGIILVSLVPNTASKDISDVTLASVISYYAFLASFDPKAGITRVALASFVSHFWHFGIFDIFILFASWDSKVDIIRYQRCLGFGIFALSWCLLVGLMMPKCQKCQNAKKKMMPKPENEWKLDFSSGVSPFSCFWCCCLSCSYP